MMRLAWLLLGLMLAAAPARAGVSVTDDTGRRVVLPAAAQRIVSLAPHVTELLYAAGAGGKLVGAVEYSDYPPAAQALPRVGSSSAVDIEAVAALKPDLVIAWQSGTRVAQYGQLDRLGIPVFVSEPRSLDDIPRTLELLGRLAGTTKDAEAAALDFRTRRDRLAARYASRPPVGVFYQIWDRPPMTVNGQHLISAVMALCGGRNVFADLAILAPTVTEEAVLAAAPEVIVASGTADARPAWLDAWRRWRSLPAVARDNLYFIPPEQLQRNTPRVLDGAAQLCEQLEQARAKRR
ncbi:periplasmic binding family protein [Methyloversatilis sp. RAC08]|uniref:cobalamin-binding protein n=1 Tax=Methyloversatilis sp. RAC08 TaxID=1842540 RepID=UPI000857A954|nr:cobalamin-binding protein [Methyloversatilis sp. RAC08]AOF83221.1 periplasmic binding family protein [Methyloversatilis sp. RAC08]